MSFCEIENRIEKIEELLENLKGRKNYILKYSGDKTYNKICSSLDECYDIIFTSQNDGLSWTKDLKHPAYDCDLCRCFTVKKIVISGTDKVLYEIGGGIYYQTAHTIEYDRKHKILVYKGYVQTELSRALPAQSEAISREKHAITKECDQVMSYEEIVKMIIHMFS